MIKRKIIQPKKHKPIKPAKRPILKSKNRVSSLETMDHPMNKIIQKNLNKYTEDRKIREHSDYSSSDSEYSSSDSDSDDFNPVINCRIKNIQTDNEEKMPKFNSLKIEGLPTAKNSTPLTENMKNGIVPKPNGCHLIVGAIGQGKSNLCANMLLNKNIWGGFFDTIILFSNSQDDVFDVLIEKGVIKKHNICHNPTEDDIQLVIDKQKACLKNANGDPSKFPTLLVILDDIIDNLQLMKSDAMKLLFIRPRQIFCTTLLLSQYALSVPKLARMQCINLMLFSGNAQEAEMYFEWLAPAGMSRKDFNELLNMAWTKTEDDKYPYLHVSRKEPPNKRFRRNFDKLIKF